MRDNKNESMHPRYSKITLKNILSTAGFLLFLSLLLTLLSIKKLPAVELIKGNIALWIFGFIDSYLLNIEYFSLTDNSIVVKKLFLKKEIILPNDISLIITKATVNSLLKGNTIYDSQIIKNRYMVCIVDYVPMEDFKKILSYSGYRKEIRYRDDVLKRILKNNPYCNFLYSFTYNIEQVQKLIASHDCQIILPKSLEGKVDLSSINVPIFVDEEG